MKPLKLLFYPDSKLRRKCINVIPEKNLSEIQKLIDEMFKTLNFYKSTGITAPQIGVGYKIITINMDGDKLCLINPELVQFEGEQEILEGCLSFPGVKGHVKRAKKIKVKYLDYNGQEQELQTEGVLANQIQHELDHLDGILYIDHVSKLRREMIMKRFKKTGRIT